MRLPVIIEHIPLGYRVDTPNFFYSVDKGRSIDDIDARFKAAAKLFSAQMRKTDPPSIPDEWKVPCKKYKGFVYGGYGPMHEHVESEADTIEELLENLKKQCIEKSMRGFSGAKQDWPTAFQITEIEI